MGYYAEECSMKGLKLPDKVYIISPQISNFLNIIANVIRENGGDNYADDLEFLSKNWFYDAQKLIQDAPMALPYIGTYLIEAEAPPKGFMEIIKDKILTSEDGLTAKLEFDA